VGGERNRKKGKIYIEGEERTEGANGRMGGVAMNLYKGLRGKRCGKIGVKKM